ncbi:MULTISPECIES: UBA domain-containing protein [Clostridium]|uniref:Ubiquitin n=1 Tax=Clostridium senegalense TaxID=1465809 RepID=A0A6M0H4W5_9CLOT|nr:MULTISPECIES: UBA/TS-N domain-containing protein [Clostridium]NEU05304.1 ubiquitin [Clostridium senegalense]
MDKLKLIDKLREKTNVSYEEAKIALENSGWDILDALLYLEEKGRVKRPSVNIFYTNETRYSEKKEENKKNKENRYESNNNFQGIFEAICKCIDTCNNIFLQIKKKDRIFLKIPLTVIIILLFFAFWMIIPLTIILLFLDIELYIYSKTINADKANRILKNISDNVKIIKEKFKKADRNG